MTTTTWVECPGAALVNLDRAVAIEARPRSDGGCSVFFFMPSGQDVLWRTFTGPTSFTDANTSVRRLLAAAGVRLITKAV